jgi:WD40 repeat protein
MTTLQLLGSQPLAPATGGAQSLAFSPDGKLLAVANNITPFAPNLNGSVSFFPVDQSGPSSGWRLSTPHQLSTGASGVGYAGALAFSAEGGLLATANCVDLSVSLFSPLNHGGIWGPVPGSPFLLQAPAHEGQPAYPYDPNALAFGPEETRTGNVAVAQLATANGRNTMSLFTANSSSGLTALGLPHSTNVNFASDPSSEGSTGVAYSRLPRITKDRPLLIATSNFEGDPGGSASLFRFYPGIQLVAGSPFMVGGQPPPNGNNNAMAVAFSPHEDMLAVAIDASGVALFLARAEGTSMAPVPGSPFAIGTASSVETSAVAFSPDGKLLAASFTAVDITHSIFKGGVALFAVTISPPSLTLLPGSPIAVSPTFANSVAFSPSGELVAVASGVGASNNGTVSLFLVV